MRLVNKLKSLALVLSLICCSFPALAEEAPKETQNDAVTQVLNSHLEKINMYGWFTQDILFNTDPASKERFSLSETGANLITMYNIDDHFSFFSDISLDDIFANGKLGIIEVERLMLNYNYSDWLQFHGGKFLSPFGIWNLQHNANPVFLSALLPTSVYGFFDEERDISHFPRVGQGVWINGNHYIEDMELEYNLYGGLFGDDQHEHIGSAEAEKDEHTAPSASIDKTLANKGAGARISFAPLENLKIGGSGYFGSDGSATNNFQNSFGADLNLKLGSFEAWSELVYSRILKADAAGKSTAYQYSLGYYAWLAYKTEINLSPYVMYGMSDLTLGTGKDSFSDITLGLNYAVNPQVFLKGEAHIILNEDPAKNFNLFITQLTAAF